MENQRKQPVATQTKTVPLLPVSLPHQYTNMASIKNVRFSFPCKENIHDMSPCQQEKHCNSCNRTIIDFRNKTQKELKAELKKNEKVCGIFSEKQIAKGYESYYQLAATAVLTVGLSILSPGVQAQEEKDPFKPSLNTSKKDTIQAEENVLVGVIIDDEYPEYPGGLQALRDFISTNVTYPSDSVEGKVWVSFVVDTSGKTQNIQIKRSLSPLADAEVIRVVKIMQFIPA